ncbi:sirohydrochlorin cobaltochelatase [Desulfosalsimonas propionicica]|uniref:Sirohydrochlorin cobaltochelatase n=1 Tax=Desulfosalsimonas propionicica TaxID=332175 RepID=A0A7W0C9B2_9BACT|nr:sirohydrochlorin cobaltochelatase [Desulfosalsimonas propionicica]MBA2881546.1 sirohydrochlorin cobaltochelatase [Desulfosalsimonas propionicica]
MKKGFFKPVLMLLILIFAAVATVQAGSPQPEEGKTAILLVTFGTTFSEAQAAFDNIEAEIKTAFADTTIQWAYTSKMIREKMAQQGKTAHSPSQALEEMAKQGFTKIFVQSLHTIAGYEYHDLVKTIRKFEHQSVGVKKITITGPLLAGPEDMAKTARVIRETIPEDRTSDEAVVLLGHGTHHPSNAAYPALMWRLQRDDKNIFIGTVEGFPGSEEILEQLEKNNISTAWLMPFMSVAGDHARNDMAGDSDDSWKSVFEAAGIECKPVLKGFAEYDPFVDIWVSQLQTAMDQ